MATNIEVRVKFMEEALRLATSVGVSVTCMYVCSMYYVSMEFAIHGHARYLLRTSIM